MTETVKISFDAEFNTRGDFDFPGQFDVISFAMVNIEQPLPEGEMTNCGFYAVSSEFDWNKVQEHNPFVVEHVLSKLFIDCFQGDESVDLETIREGVKDYIKQQVEKNPDATHVEFWSKNGTLDEFILCQILFDDMGDFYSFMNDLGIGFGKTSFKDIDTIFKFPDPVFIPPENDLKKSHNSFYDAVYQARIIQWADTEFDLRIKQPDTKMPTPWGKPRKWALS